MICYDINAAIGKMQDWIICYSPATVVIWRRCKMFDEPSHVGFIIARDKALMTAEQATTASLMA